MYIERKLGDSSYDVDCSDWMRVDCDDWHVLTVFLCLVTIELGQVSVGRVVRIENQNLYKAQFPLIICMRYFFVNYAIF